MKPRICICCGEEMAEAGNTLSRNPNVCASCSSLADGMDQPACPELSDAPQMLQLEPQNPVPQPEPKEIERSSRTQRH